MTNELCIWCSIANQSPSYHESPTCADEFESRNWRLKPKQDPTPKDPEPQSIARFCQIVATDHALYALDSSGAVWIYISPRWSKLSEKRG